MSHRGGRDLPQSHQSMKPRSYSHFPHSLRPCGPLCDLTPLAPSHTARGEHPRSYCCSSLPRRQSVTNRRDMRGNTRIVVIRSEGDIESPRAAPGTVTTPPSEPNMEYEPGMVSYKTVRSGKSTSRGQTGKDTGISAPFDSSQAQWNS